MAPETPAQRPAPRYFTWDEVAQRCGRGQERWLVIERKVYNISEFSRRHPGGSRVIGHYAGQDATVSAADGARGKAGGSGRGTGSLASRTEHRLVRGEAGGARAYLLPRDGASCAPGVPAEERLRTRVGVEAGRSHSHQGRRPCVRSKGAGRPERGWEGLG